MGSVLSLAVHDPLATTQQLLLAEDLECLHRIRDEYLEMPGLCPTRSQAARLWGLSCDRCDMLLTVLIEEQFLVLTNDGRFIRYGGDGGR